jgi:HSP20 family molecular chaperone IbpA
VTSLIPVLEFSFLPAGESRELVDDLRQVFADLDSALTPEQRAYSGEYHPALDVVETSDAVEIVVDVAGVPAAAIRARRVDRRGQAQTIRVDTETRRPA